MCKKKVLQITTLDIIEDLKGGFGNIYKPFSSYPNENGKLWLLCLDIVSSQEILNNIIFCNDVLNIPPVKVLQALHQEIINELSMYDKKFIGAFWGFVFKNTFGYKSQKQVGIASLSVIDPIHKAHVIKTATYFYDNDTKIKVI